MMQFHQDGINWGDFSIRKTLYNPDLHQNTDQLSNMQPDRFFNIPISELKNRFNQQTTQKPHRYIYQPKQHPLIVNMVHELCQKAGIPMLSVILFNTPKIGASTFPGTEIDISKGAVDQLSKSELKALLAHEVAHNVVYTKHLNLPHEETTADIMGARLSSKSGMIHLLRYFARHAATSNVSTHDQEHDPDQIRIDKLKRTFKKYHAKKNRIQRLRQKLDHTQQQNHDLQTRLKIRHQKQLTIKRLRQKIRSTIRQNQNHL